MVRLKICLLIIKIKIQKIKPFVCFRASTSLSNIIDRLNEYKKSILIIQKILALIKIFKFKKFKLSPLCLKKK